MFCPAKAVPSGRGQFGTVPSKQYLPDVTILTLLGHTLSGGLEGGARIA